jgi:hypothetical protein
MNRSLLFCAVLTAAMLAACATATPYQPLKAGEGYSEQKLEPNRYRIAFAANSATPRQKANDYVLLRAAELTLEKGYDYFVLTGQSTGSEPRSSAMSVGIGGFSFGGSGGVGAGVGVGTGGGNDYTHVADIVMFKGAKPENDPNAFDAHAVKENLEGSSNKGAAS